MMKACSSVFVFLSLLVFVYADSPSTPSSAGSCDGNPCPSYTVVKSYADGIEERQYNNFVVASFNSSHSRCMSYSWALSQAYMKLSLFTRAGQNAEKKRLAMGVPVVVKGDWSKRDAEPRCAIQYTTSFYLGNSLQDFQSLSTDEVSVEQFPSVQFYTYTFDGLVENPTDLVVNFRIKLNELELCYNRWEFYVAMYNSPSSALHRTNEIWVPVGSCSN